MKYRAQQIINLIIFFCLIITVYLQNKEIKHMRIELNSYTIKNELNGAQFKFNKSNDSVTTSFDSINK
jgi:hypothetical protein